MICMSFGEDNTVSTEINVVSIEYCAMRGSIVLLAIAISLVKKSQDEENKVISRDDSSF